MKTSAAPFLVGFLVAFLIIVAAYTGGYFLLSETAELTSLSSAKRTTRLRVYKAAWMEWAFFPAGKIESLATSDDVYVRSGVLFRD